MRKNQRNVCHMKIHVYTCIRILVEHPQPWSGTNQLQPGGGWFVKWKLEISCQWKLLYFWAKNALISPPEFNRFFPKLLLLYCSYFSYRGEGSQILRGGCRTRSCLRRRLMFNWCVGECTQIFWVRFGQGKGRGEGRCLRWRLMFHWWYWVNVPNFFLEPFWGATGLFNAMMQQLIWCLLLLCFVK